MLKLARVMSLVLIATLVGCAAPLKKTELETVKKIAVVNTFPAHPNYALIGTTIFNNEYDEITDSQFFEKVTDVVINHLSKKGYAELCSSRTKL